jgi:quinolinate synthase
VSAATPISAPKEAVLPFEPYEALDGPELVQRIETAREALGDKLLILGHHYQRDEVVRFAHLTGDSFGLSRQAADSSAPWIVFCGVHFMAESADILTLGERNVILPDMKAGCTMADMADIDQVEYAWERIAAACDQTVVPITYMNSEAALKAFCGRNGGAVCTSSNAEAILRWAFEQGEKVLFFPDQHLGRNTARLCMEIPLDDMQVWDPDAPEGLEPDLIRRSRVLLWKGHCSVHMNFLPEHVDIMRAQFPGINILVHPECSHEVVRKADLFGSTDFIIRTLEASEPGSSWAIGTEQHLVMRLKQRFPDREVHMLSPFVCNCATMYRIDLPHLAWVLENIRQGCAPHRIRVPAETAKWARVALDRMLAIH